MSHASQSIKVQLMKEIMQKLVIEVLKWLSIKYKEDYIVKNALEPEYSDQLWKRILKWALRALLELLDKDWHTSA